MSHISTENPNSDKQKKLRVKVQGTCICGLENFIEFCEYLHKSVLSGSCQKQFLRVASSFMICV